MAFRWLQAAAAMLLIALLLSCSMVGRQPIERPLYYDVRDVAVIADARVSQVMIAGVDRRIAEAIAVTRRPVALPRVVMTVSIRDYAPGGSFGDRRPRTTFNVVATSVDNGMDIAAGTFTVFSGTDNPYMIDESLAEQVAARVRFAFSLATPPAVRRERARPNSTQMQVEPAGRAAPEQPAAPTPAPVADSRPAARANAASVPATPTDARAIPPVIPPANPPSTIPPVIPVAPAPVPSAKSRSGAAGPSVGTNVEEGANGSIKLGVPACDPSQDPECAQPAQ